MDLSKIKVKDSITLDIIHPDLDGISFELAGPNHAVTLKAKRDNQDRFAKMRRNLKPDELDKIGRDNISARVLSWKGVEWEGKKLECTPENVAMILGNPNLSFIQDQIAASLRADEDFFGK